MDEQSQKRLDAYNDLESARKAFRKALERYIDGQMPAETAEAVRDKLITDMDRALSDLYKAFGLD